MKVDDPVVVLNPPNSGPRMREVWAFVSRDALGRENVLGANFGGGEMVALMTGNPRMFEIFARYVLEFQVLLEAGDKTIHLLHFTNREEIDWHAGRTN
jgi:hypothetical protein